MVGLAGTTVQLSVDRRTHELKGGIRAAGASCRPSLASRGNASAMRVKQRLVVVF